MDLLKSLLITFLIMPTVALAEERTRDQHTYSLAVMNYEYYPDPAEGCAWAAPFLYAEPIAGAVAEVYSTTTDPANGRISVGDTMIGTLWVCFDAGGEVIGPGTRIGYSQGEAYYLNVGGVEMGALGTVVAVTPQGFPEPSPGTGVFSTSAALVLLQDGEPGDPIGALNSTFLQVPASAGYPVVNYLTLRLFPPRDYNQEALQDAIEAAF